ncbi:hypothetical protein [Chlorobium ferrooxidans]|nr:hypothetical protein [Chlorobium ferrooxidans]
MTKMPLEKPFDEYIRCEADILIGKSVVKNTKTKCFLWLPNSFSAEPHFYLLLEKSEDIEVFSRGVEKRLRSINLKISNSETNGRTNCNNHIIREAYFAGLQTTRIAENWSECFVKYHFPKYVYSYGKGNDDTKCRFFISESELLMTQLHTEEHYTGNIKRKVVSNIQFGSEVEHLGIKMISTDRYIGRFESNILEVIADNPLCSLLSLYKKVIPVVDIILLLTSFAERRRHNWYKCDGMIKESLFVCYNTRKSFFKDKKVFRLISEYSFKEYLGNSLKNIGYSNLVYVKRLLQSYLSGVDYSMNAQIILWNSILEKILKNNFEKKRDEDKQELIDKMSVYTVDLPEMKGMIDIRNLIAHGDDVEPKQLLLFHDSWQTLIERVILRELKWGNLSETDVAPHGSKSRGLV